MKKVLLLVLAALALAGCGIGNPWPGVTPTATHHTVLAVGDSLMGQNDFSLSNVLHNRGFTDVTVVDAHINGIGLIGGVPYTAPDGTVTWYDDALAWLNHNLDTYPDADTVLIEFGGACGFCDGTRGPLIGSDEFYSQWSNNAIALIDAAQARGKTVIYTVSPPFAGSGDTIASGSPFHADAASLLSFLDAVVISPHTGNPYADWWKALADTPDNKYEPFLLYDGAIHNVRTNDGVHIALDGSIRTATWTASTLGRVWAAAPAGVQGFATPRAPGLVQAGDPVQLGT